MSLFFCEGGISISIPYWLQKDPKSFLEAFKSFLILYWSFSCEHNFNPSFITSLMRFP